MRPRALCLVGLRGAGKSTAGAEVARRLRRPFVDLDRALETRAGRTVREVLEAEGEGAFRALEVEVLSEALALLPGAVVATGGGVVVTAAGRAALEGALVVYLAAPPEVLAARVAADPASAELRPPLVPGATGVAEAAALGRERDGLYRGVAAAVVDAAGPPATVVEALLAVVAARDHAA